MDYKEIGKRIRQYRKANNLSQTQLAEQINISVVYMSHIETANTKVSLPIIVRIAEALHVHIDELSSEIFDILSDCTPRESALLLEVLRSVKQSFDRYFGYEKNRAFWKEHS